MSATNKSRLGRGWIVLLVIMGLVDLALVLRYFLLGKNVRIFNPQGLIADDQFHLIVFTIVLGLAVAVPVILTLYFMAWKYRESNIKAVHKPDARPSRFYIFFIWALPTFFMLLLMMVMWPATHKLEPRRLIASSAEPITIQVIAQRWKWVFLYPDQDIATVNYVQIPKDTPVTFELTADDAPMSSFWIPNLSGQLYAMTGHVNRLNLLADTVGDYPGSSAEINGAGFAGMKFTTHVSSASDFAVWVQTMHQSSDVLDAASYAKLVKPSEDNPATMYASYPSNLYATVLSKYSAGHSGHEGHE